MARPECLRFCLVFPEVLLNGVTRELFTWSLGEYQRILNWRQLVVLRFFGQSISWTGAFDPKSSLSPWPRQRALCN